MNIRLIPKSPIKILLEPVSFFPSEFDLEKVYIPAGFAFDGLSLPRGLQFLRSPNNNDDIIADIYHAYIYSSLCKNVSRKEGDNKLRADLKGWGRHAIFYGLRLLGWISWKRDTNFTRHKDKIIKARKELGLPESIS